MSSSPVAVSRDDRVAIITIDNAPVNALSQPVRAGLLAAVQAINDDESVDAAIIRCAGRTFIAGADVHEFSRPVEPPFLPEVTQAIEDSRKPIVSALHGTVLGGGFEVALATHWRVALPSTQFGLPEVKLGLLPGAGGTQRLPRLVGVERALTLICGGDPISAASALEWGAIDEIATDFVDMAAIAAARHLAANPHSLRRTGELTTAAISTDALAKAERAAIGKSAMRAPQACAEAVVASQTASLPEGLALERRLFLELRGSAQSQALRHAFFGEREVAKVPDFPKGTPTREVSRVAVIGAGTMGTGIAMCFVNVGVPVVLLEVNQEALDRGIGMIRKSYASSAARGSLTPVEMQARVDLIEPTTSWEALAQVDLMIEAVFEELDIKRDVLQKMDRIAKPGAILATNTSYLDVAMLARATARAPDVIGLHFFSPANVMKLLEVVRTPLTAPDVRATAMKVGKTLGKIAVMVGGSDGFVGNRMLAQRTREAFFLLEEGALPEQVDRVLVEFGFPMGPFAVGDLAGLDIGWRNRKSRAHLRKPGVRDCDLLDQVCELGRLGQKTSAGWYRYEPGSRTPIADPAIEQLIRDHSRRKGIERRVITDQEIIERCLYSMINEGAKILEEGVASRPVDVDMVWLHGYGFPRWRGGPLFHADAVGLGNVLNAIVKYQRQVGDDFWAPAALLCRLAAEGRGFYDPTT